MTVAREGHLVPSEEKGDGVRAGRIRSVIVEARTAKSRQDTADLVGNARVGGGEVAKALVRGVQSL